SDNTLQRVFAKPLSLDTPPRICFHHSSEKCRAVENYDTLMRSCPNQGRMSCDSGSNPSLGSLRPSLNRNFENWTEAHNIVVPENGLQFWQVCFRQVSARIHRPEVHAANLQWQRIRLRRHHKIRAQTPEFFRQPVAHIQRHAQGRSDYSHAQRQRRPGKELMARTASKRISNNS